MATFLSKKIMDKAEAESMWLEPVSWVTGCIGMTLTRCEHTFYSGNEGAVSEVIGSIMLISIVVIAVSIVGVVLWSQPPPEKIPVPTL